MHGGRKRKYYEKKKGDEDREREMNNGE